ncbi:MAG: hypothetical protein FWH41_04690 [Treponema sp.]|nr:hypothetical protein [Treponema sp.]
MKYTAQFCKAWTGKWEFDAIDDARAWEKAKNYIKGHVQSVIVDIAAIYESDNNNKQIRKLPEYAECKRITAKIEREKKEKRKEIIYIAYFTDGTRSEPFAVKNILQETDSKYTTQKSFVEETAKQKFTKKIKTVKNSLKAAYRNNKKAAIEEILLNEKAVYKAYFSDGACSAPYIAEITVNNISAKKKAKFKLKQHAEYNGLDVNKLKVIKIEELNEDKNFIPNRDFLARNNRRKETKMQTRKNRFIENVEI